MAELTLQESERGVSSNEAHSDPHLPSVKYIVSTSKQGNILLRNQNGTEVTLATNEDLQNEINNDKKIVEITIKLSLQNDDQSLPKAIIHRCVQLHYLTKLDMTGTLLPRYSLDRNLQFDDMINLDTLILDDTNTRLLHPSIGRLQNLKVLSLQFNKLYDLPVTVRLLHRLEDLKITGNLYRSLPGAVYHLKNLKNIEGLNENLLENYPGWQEKEVPIATINPLSIPNPPRNFVETLANISFSFAVGTNIWSIPLPNHYKERIVQLATRHDLCEVCYTAVKKIMADQETNGHVIKVCMTTFKHAETVPFSFLTCSIDCRDKTVAWLKRLLQQQQQFYRANKMRTKVNLKEQYAKPILLKRKDFADGSFRSSSTTDGENNNENSSSRCTIS